MKRLYCPFKYRYELVEWAIKYMNIKPSKVKAMKKNQLYAMWYNHNYRNE